MCSAVLLEVAHFASVSDVSREVCVLRSDNGITWYEHPVPATDDNVSAVLANNFDSKQFTAVLLCVLANVNSLYVVVNPSVCLSSVCQ